jgi:outer membrane protein insertion porin family
MQPLKHFFLYLTYTMTAYFPFSSMRVLLFLLLSLSVSQSFAQTSRDSLLPLVDYTSVQEYEIGGIKVTGATFTDANALISISGLQVGQKIKIPSTETSQAMKNLWKLKLFTDVAINQERTAGEIIFLEIAVQELPRYTRHSFSGVKKNKHDDLNTTVNKFLTKGTIFNENARVSVANALRKDFVEKGYLDSKITVLNTPDEKATNATKLEIKIDKGKRVKIKDIDFVGNTSVKDRKLRKKMKETTIARRIFKKSKFIRDEYTSDKTKIEQYFNTIGYRDAHIISDSVWRNEKGKLMIRIVLDQGRQYFFRNINWKGNTIHESKYLSQVLGINRGDVYNQELLDNRLKFSQDGRDVSSLYLDNGYLFFTVDPVEVAVDGDSIDLEMRIYEGPQATIDRVIINGNDRTHDHVIRRELHTRPGDKFSRSDIIRSQREIINLGYFNQEALGINTPVNPQRGTVDIEYTVEEKPSDQLELSAGYQPSTAFNSGGVIGTLGITFNNFSLRNIKHRETWNPLPQGDGQRLSLRAQTAGERFQSYNFSFTEPWLGGKKPNSLTVGGVFNRFSQGFANTPTFARLDLMQGSIGFGTRLKWPDNNFILRADLDIQTLNLTNWGGFTSPRGSIGNGTYNNWSLGFTLARNSINDPIFPRNGSLISFKANITPPYGLFKRGFDAQTASVQQFYRWIEYAKYRIDADWYSQIVGKLTLRTSAKMGILTRLTRKSGLTPFERYELGGDGLNNINFGLNGRDIVSMRGYESGDISGNGVGGAAVFNKYTMELRYPISLNPSSSIYVMAFAQAANAWSASRDWNPFDLKRTAGLGFRVFLPMFGTLGVDYGFGFDRPDLINNPGTKWKDYGNLNIVLGFEPD